MERRNRTTPDGADARRDDGTTEPRVTPRRTRYGLQICAVCCDNAVSGRNQEHVYPNKTWQDPNNSSKTITGQVNGLVDQTHRRTSRSFTRRTPGEKRADEKAAVAATAATATSGLGQSEGLSAAPEE